MFRINFHFLSITLNYYFLDYGDFGHHLQVCTQGKCLTHLTLVLALLWRKARVQQ